MLTSKENQHIKQAIKLIHSSKKRREDRLFFVEGLRLCEDAAKSQIKIKQCFFHSSLMEKYPQRMQRILNASKQQYEITWEIAQKLSDTQNSQGVFCICEILDKSETLSKIEKGNRYIGLEEIQDPSNLGTMLRTAEALGINGAILSQGCCDVYSPKVIRGSMGAIFRLPIFEVSDFTNTITEYKKNGMRIYASVPHCEAKLVTDISDYSQSIVLIGNEANGIKAETIEIADEKVTIPMKGRAESLNASAAASILMWEMMRG